MKPGDFFLGVLDFFAVLIPGSLAAWLVTRYVPASTLKGALMLPGEDGSTPHWLVAAAAFAVSSYVLGHFVFMAGSKLDSSFDRWRRRVHSFERDKAFRAADNLRKTITPQMDGAELSTLKWARAYIQVRSAGARVEIDRLEAEQKFFRSFVVIALLFAVHFIVREGALFGGILCMIMAVLSYQRYLDRRWTMTELIYATAVIISVVEEFAQDRGSEASDSASSDD
jgi:hypothetical protein